MPKPKNTDEIAGTIWEQLGIDDPAEKPAKAAAAPEGPSTAELLSRLDRIERENDTLRQTNMALMSAPGSQSSGSGTQSQPNPPPEVDLSGLPDQSEDPAGYAKELNRRISSAISQNVRWHTEQVSSQQNARANASQRVDALWEDFEKSFPDLAGEADRVEFAAQRAVKKAAARGLDVEKYMFVTSKQFFADVAEEIKSTFGEPKTKEADEDDDAPAPKTKNKGEDDDDPGRSMSIFGGQESSSASDKGGTKGGEKPGDFMKDLQDMQRATGFF